MDYVTIIYTLKYNLGFCIPHRHLLACRNVNHIFACRSWKNMAQMPVFLRKQNETIKVTWVTVTLWRFLHPWCLLPLSPCPHRKQFQPVKPQQKLIISTSGYLSHFLACTSWFWLLNDLLIYSFISFFLSCLSFSP